MKSRALDEIEYWEITTVMGSKNAPYWETEHFEHIFLPTTYNLLSNDEKRIYENGK